MKRKTARGRDPRSDRDLLQVVEGFVVRARRITAHSLVSEDADLAELTHLANGGWSASREGDEVRIKRSLPPEEQLESLAARVRPTILKRDPVRYDYVLNALSSYLARHEAPTPDLAWCQELKDDWRSVDPESGTMTYYVRKGETDAPETETEITDAALALTWFYGDLVHADTDRISVGEPFGIGLRYAAAAVRTAQLAILARDTLSFITHLVDADLLPLDAVTFEVAVVTGSEPDLKLTGAHVAQGGTPVQALGAPIGQAWQSLKDRWPEGVSELSLRIPWGRAP